MSIGPSVPSTGRRLHHRLRVGHVHRESVRAPARPFDFVGRTNQALAAPADHDDGVTPAPERLGHSPADTSAGPRDYYNLIWHGAYPSQKLWPQPETRDEPAEAHQGGFSAGNGS